MWSRVPPKRRGRFSLDFDSAQSPRVGFFLKLCKSECSSGGIGRHAGLKILWAFARAGSSPASSTNERKTKTMSWFFCFGNSTNLGYVIVYKTKNYPAKIDFSFSKCSNWDSAKLIPALSTNREALTK